MPKDKQVQYSFKPKIGEMKTAEMFRSMQKSFESQLQRKKSQVSTTTPKSPKFTKTKTRPLERSYVNEAPPQPDKLKQLLAKSMTKPSTQVKQPSSTRAMELASQRRREEIEAKRKADEKAAKEETLRKEKQAKLKAASTGGVSKRLTESKGDSNLARLRTIHTYLETMEKSGMSKQQAEKMITKEEKEMLEEEKFLEARKKQYGKV